MTSILRNLRLRVENRPKTEDGLVLPMALLMISVVAVVMVALLTYSSASSVSAGTNRVIAERVYAAHGGVDVAIQDIRHGSTLCLDPAQTLTVTYYEGLANERSATATCVPVDPNPADADVPSVLGPSGWSVFVPAGGTISTTGGNALSRAITGPVYNGGSWNLSASAPLEVVAGQVMTCPVTVANLVTSPVADNTRCGDPMTTPAAPEPIAFPGALPAAAAVPTTFGTGAGACRVFTPGTYTAAPELSPNNYFTAGVYYFDNIGPWVIDRLVVAGKSPLVADAVGPGQHPLDSRIGTVDLTGAGCANEYATASGAGTGVLFVFGGNSSISVATDGRFEMFPQVDPVDRPLTPGIAIRALQAGAAWGAPSNLGATPLLEVAPGSTNAELIVHGVTYAPTQTINLLADATNKMALAGSVVAQNLNMEAAAVIGTTQIFGVSTGDSATERKVQITSESATVSGTSQLIVGIATVTVYNDETKRMAIDSWRVERRQP